MCIVALASRASLYRYLREFIFALVFVFVVVVVGVPSFDEERLKEEEDDFVFLFFLYVSKTFFAFVCRRPCLLLGASFVVFPVTNESGWRVVATSSSSLYALLSLGVVVDFDLSHFSIQLSNLAASKTFSNLSLSNTDFVENP